MPPPTRVFWKLLPEIACRRELSSNAKVVHAYLLDRQGANTTAWPGQSTIGKACGMSRHAVIRTLRELESHALISTTRAPMPALGGKRDTNRYSVSAEWTSANTALVANPHGGSANTALVTSAPAHYPSAILQHDPDQGSISENPNQRERANKDSLSPDALEGADPDPEVNHLEKQAREIAAKHEANMQMHLHRKMPARNSDIKLIVKLLRDGATPEQVAYAFRVAVSDALHDSKNVLWCAYRTMVANYDKHIAGSDASLKAREPKPEPPPEPPRSARVQAALDKHYFEIMFADDAQKREFERLVDAGEDPDAAVALAKAFKPRSVRDL